MNYIKRVYRVLNRIINHQSLKYSNYLENGIYYFSCFWGGQGKKINRERVITNIEDPKSLGIVYSKEKLFKGSEFYSREGGSSIRFFDKKNKRMLTIFDKLEFLKEYMDKKEKGKNFQQPKILDIDYKKLSLEEEYIEHEEIEQQFLFLKILKALRNGYEKSEKLEWVNCGEYFNEQHKKLGKYLTEEIKLENILIPNIFSHGDLHFKNVINTEKNLYIIDWDSHGELTFVYDVFYCIFHDYFFKNDENRYLCTEYFKGSFDEKITENFDYFGVTYDSSLKFIYFYLTILQYIKHHNVNSEEELKIYGKRIMKMEELYQKI